MRLADLCGIRSGGTVVCAGNGTTLNEFDLSKIAHPLVAVNYFIPFGVAKWGRLPDCFFCHDPSVLFAPWEAHRRFKQLPAPPDYDPVVASVSPADFLTNKWDLVKAVLPAHLGWWRGFGSKAVMRGVSRAECDLWLARHRPAFYAYEPVLPARLAWKARLRRRLRGYKRLDFDPWAWPGLSWLDRLLAPVGPGFVHELNNNRILLWAVNSFCSVILPILLWMGWQRIVLIGVDFDKSGYFFCPYQSPSGQRFFYEEEYRELFTLFTLAKRLPHRPVIQAVNTGRNLYRPPDGLVEFEELCR